MALSQQRHVPSPVIFIISAYLITSIFVSAGLAAKQSLDAQYHILGQDVGDLDFDPTGK